MFIAALSRIDKIWKQPKCLNGYMDKEDVVYTHTHTHTHTHSRMLFSLKKGDSAICSNLMKVENIMLSKINQKEKYYMISLADSKKSQIHRIRQ